MKTTLKNFIVKRLFKLMVRAHVYISGFVQEFSSGMKLGGSRKR